MAQHRYNIPIANNVYRARPLAGVLTIDSVNDYYSFRLMTHTYEVRRPCLYICFLHTQPSRDPWSSDSAVRDPRTRRSYGSTYSVTTRLLITYLLHSCPMDNTYIYIRIHTHVCMHICTYIPTHSNTHIERESDIYQKEKRKRRRDTKTRNNKRTGHTYTHIHSQATRTYIHTYIHTLTYILYMCIHIHAYAWTCTTYIHTYIQTQYTLTYKFTYAHTT